MEITNIQTIQNCENQFQKRIIFFKNKITKKEIFLFSENKNLIFNENFPISHFKIIDENLIIRGSIGTNRIVIDFNSENKEKCDLLLNEFLAKIFY